MSVGRVPLVSSFIQSVKSESLTDDGRYYAESTFLPTTTLPSQFLKLPFLDERLRDPFVQLVVLGSRILGGITPKPLKTPTLCMIRSKGVPGRKRVCTIISAKVLLDDGSETEDDADLPQVAFLSPCLAFYLNNPTHVSIAVSKSALDIAVESIEVARSITMSPVVRKGVLETISFPPHGSKRLAISIRQRFYRRGLGTLVHPHDILPLYLNKGLDVDEDASEDEVGGGMQGVVLMFVDKIVSQNGHEKDDCNFRIEMGTTAIVRGDEIPVEITTDMQEALDVQWGNQVDKFPRALLPSALGFRTEFGWVGNIVIEGGTAAFYEIENSRCPGIVILPLKGWSGEEEIEEVVSRALRLGSRIKSDENRGMRRVGVLLVVRGWDYWEGRWRAKQGRAQRAGNGLERILWGQREPKAVGIVALCSDVDKMDAELRALFTHEVHWGEPQRDYSKEVRCAFSESAIKNEAVPRNPSEMDKNGVRNVDEETLDMKAWNRHERDSNKVSSMRNKIRRGKNAVTWDDVGGLEEVKQDIIEMVEYRERFSHLFASESNRRGGILLYGPPGTGKTLLARAVADSCNLSFIGVKGPELLDSYVGESEKNVRRVFERARRQAPCVVFFDELDALAPVRGMGRDSAGVTDRVVGMLAGELEETVATGNIFVIGATNRPDLVDSGLMRAGRFDKRVFVPLPESRATQMQILLALTRKFTFDSNVNQVVWRRVVNLLPEPPSLSGADLYSMATDAWMAAAKRTARILSNLQKKEVMEDNQKSLFDVALDEEERTRRRFFRGSLQDHKSIDDSTEGDSVVTVVEQDLLRAAQKAKSSLRRSEVDKYYKLRDQLDGNA